MAKDKARAALAAVQRVDAALARLGGATVAEARTKPWRELAAEVRRLEAERAQAIAGLSAAELAQARAKESAARAARVREAGSRLEALLALSAEAAARDQRISAARRAVPVLAAIEAREGLDAELEAALSKLGERRALIAELASRELEMSRAREEAAKRADEIAAADRELGELEVAGKAWAEAEAARLEIERKRSETAAVSARLAAAREAELRALEARDATAVGSEEEAAIRASFESDRASATVAEAAQKEAESVTALAEKADKLRRASAAAAAEASTASERLAEAVRSLAALEAAESANLAGRLALGLAPGEMCPSAARGSIRRSRHPISLLTAIWRIPNALFRWRAKRGRPPARPKPIRAPGRSRLRCAPWKQRKNWVDWPKDILRRRFPRRARARRPHPSRSRSRRSDCGRWRRGGRPFRASKRRSRMRVSRAARPKPRRKRPRSSLPGSSPSSYLPSPGAGPEDPGPRAARRASEARPRLLGARQTRREYSSWATALREAVALASELASRVEDLRLRLAEAAESRPPPWPMPASKGPRPRETHDRSRKARSRSGSRDLSRRSRGRPRCGPGYRRRGFRRSARRRRIFRRGVPCRGRPVGQGVEGRMQALLDEARAKLDARSRERNERERLQAERKELDAAWSRMSTLSALLNGEMPGRRLPFKNYALGAYFRVVVERASARLAQMSDGRYALAADEGSGRGKAGLELLVRDAHTGQSRPAGTLSGGERFLTSLEPRARPGGHDTGALGRRLARRDFHRRGLRLARRRGPRSRHLRARRGPGREDDRHRLARRRAQGEDAFEDRGQQGPLRLERPHGILKGMSLGLPVEPYAAAMIACALVSLLLSARSLFGTRKALSGSFAFLQATIFVWSLFRLVQWEILSKAGQLEALKFQYLGIAFVPAAYYMVARAMVKIPAKGIEIPLILLPGFAVVALLAVGRLNRYFWNGDELSRLPINPQGAWGFWAFIVYSVILISIALLIMVRACFRARGIVGRGMRYLTVFLAVPSATNAVFLAFFFRSTGYDPTPIAFAVSGILIAIVLRQFDLLDAVPYAKSVLLESLDSPLIVVDPEGLVAGSNDESKRISPAIDRLEGRPISEIVSALDGREKEGDAKEWSFGGVDYQITCHEVRQRGKWSGRFYLFRDISALVKARREIEEARNRADEMSALKSAFVATVSHELRNPLNAIIGLADLNLRAGPPPAIKDDLEVILSSGNILLGLVNDLLDLSKIEAGRMELERVDFDLHEKASSMLKSFRPAVEKKGVFLDISIEDGTPRYVKGDPLRYGQILMNLVSNAVKFTSSGAVTVSLASLEPRK